ncbi:ATP-binding protein [Fulvimarina sp. 2208YS6-2-32]|uniref:ATP-binding protein n=1 Tax=Fulvimarina uroteuthidis TaxID=3098149 RepID=A0ABU5I5Y0_9HYPH|nr:ATP-binding protein [Fulvimarina sp. 2208YS6-2-32]MDY8110777.1 ATP-binding protein [Fulvimarina sp. 2208YS6-2-32]
MTTVTLAKSQDVAFARQAAMKAMGEIGASAVKRTKFVTAVSEIARNAVNYGRGGRITFEIVGLGANRRVIAQCSDRGPGIEDVDLALSDGYSTGKSLGLGLGGAKRLVDRFDITSSSSTGTIVTLECGQR